MEVKQIISNLPFKYELGFEQKEIVKIFINYFSNDEILIQLEKYLLKCKNQNENKVIKDLIQYRKNIIIEYLKTCKDKT